MDEKKWDVFISHASEDKESIVKPLAEFLAALGVKVWYDDFTLSVGDSLSRSIDKGLAESKYGIIILSTSFFSKDWPEYELRGLTAKEIGHEKVILPLWHKVTREDVLKYSPSLADKLALRTEDYSLLEIAIRLLETIRPDILTKLHKKIAFLQQIQSGELKKIDTRKLIFPPIRHKELPDELITRIRLIRAALLEAYTHSMEFWVDGFKRDAHPSTEIAWWEHVAACFLEFIRMTELRPDQVSHVFMVVFGLCNNWEKTEFEEHIASISAEDFEKIERIVKYKIPIYDFEEKFPDIASKLSPDQLKRMLDVDKEEFT